MKLLMSSSHSRVARLLRSPWVEVGVQFIFVALVIAAVAIVFKL